MKKIYITLLFALYGALAYGQQPTNEDKRVNQWLDYKQSIADQRAELMETRHQIRFGVGLYDHSSDLILISSVATTNPALVLDYSYRILEFLEIGAFASMASNSIKKYEKPLGSTVNRHTSTEEYRDISVGVYGRYAWLNRRWVSLYSAVGMNFSYNETDKYSATNPDIYETTIVRSINYHLIPVGVRVGGRIFGYIEPWVINSNLGVSFNVGVGYKF